MHNLVVKRCRPRCGDAAHHSHSPYETIPAGVSVQKITVLPKLQKTTLYTGGCVTPKVARGQGATPTLSANQEDQLEKWILTTSASGYPSLNTTAIAEAARKLFPQQATADYGKNWYRNYCSRHPRVAHVMANAPVWPATGNFTSQQLRAWFQHISTYLCAAGVEAVRQQPQRVFHCMYGRYKAMSAMLAYSASCCATPPLLVLPPEVEALALPYGWARYNCAHAANISDQVLLYYLEHVLHRYLQHLKLEFPIIVYMDHQRQAPGAKVFELCERLQIVLVNLYAVAFNNLHAELAHGIQVWQVDTNTLKYNDQYARGVEALKHALVFTLIKKKMVQSFQDYGIYPFDLSAVDMRQLAQDDKYRADNMKKDLDADADVGADADEDDTAKDNACDNDRESWTIYTYVHSSDSE